MTNDPQSSHLRDRIRYWDDVLDRARSSEYASLRSIAVEANTYQGMGPKTEARVREALEDRCKRRLDTLYTALGQYMLGIEDQRGLKW